MRSRNSLVLLAAFWLAVTVSGCATPAYRAHPALDSYSTKIRTAALLPADIKVYALSAGGVEELRDDWSEQGRKNVEKAVIDHLKRHKVKVKKIRVNKSNKSQVRDIHALYKAVSDSILLHTYVQGHTFPEKVKNFEYSVGSIDKLVQPYGADALIIVYGSDEISTGGRKALKAVGAVFGAITGVQGPRSGITEMSVALVDRSGMVLWYNIRGNEGGFDLRKQQNAAGFVSQVMFDFPKVGR